jgi:hypothetical protein
LVPASGNLILVVVCTLLHLGGTVTVFLCTATTFSGIEWGKSPKVLLTWSRSCCCVVLVINYAQLH